MADILTQCMEKEGVIDSKSYNLGYGVQEPLDDETSPLSKEIRS